MIELYIISTTFLFLYFEILFSWKLQFYSCFVDPEVTKPSVTFINRTSSLLKCGKSLFQSQHTKSFRLKIWKSREVPKPDRWLNMLFLEMRSRTISEEKFSSVHRKNWWVYCNDLSFLGLKHRNTSRQAVQLLVFTTEQKRHGENTRQLHSSGNLEPLYCPYVLFGRQL